MQFIVVASLALPALAYVLLRGRLARRYRIDRTAISRDQQSPIAINFDPPLDLALRGAETSRGSEADHLAHDTAASPKQPALPFDPFKAGHASPSLSGDRAAAHPIGRRYRLEYADIEGEVSQRDIRIDAVRGLGSHVILDAYCFLRQDTRHFRVDRVLAIFDVATGEPIRDPLAFFAHFVPRLPPAIEERSSSVGEVSVAFTREEHRLLDRVMPGLDVLLWVARADAALTGDDESAMLAYVRDRLALPTSRTHDLAWDPAFVLKWLRRRRPTLAMCTAFLVDLPAKSRERPLLNASLTTIAVTDGRRKRLAQLARHLDR